MPISDAAVRAFYDELLADGDLSPQERESLSALMEKKEGKFKSGVLAQREFQSQLDRNKNELAQKKREYDEQLAAVTGLQDQLNSGHVPKADYDALQLQLTNERSALQALRTSYLGAVDKIRATYNNPDDILKTVGLDPNGVPAPSASNTGTGSGAPSPGTGSNGTGTPAFDPNKFIAREEGNRAMSGMAEAMFIIPALAAEYQQITGKTFDTRDAWNRFQTNAASRNPLPLLDFIEQAYEFPKLRADAQEASIQARIKKGIDEGLTAERSKLLAAQTQSSGDQVRAADLLGTAEDISQLPEGLHAVPKGGSEMYKDAEAQALAELSKIRAGDQHVM